MMKLALVGIFCFHAALAFKISNAPTCGIENHNGPWGDYSSGGNDYSSGGEETQKNQYPWMVRLSVNEKRIEVMGQTFISSLLCGGTIISSKYVLTAAHCVTNEDDHNKKYPSSSIKVVIGDHNKDPNIHENMEKEINVEEVIVHHSYFHIKHLITENDIALLKLAKKVDLNVYTPICLPRSGENTVGRKVMALGWGTTEDGKTSKVLRSVDLKVDRKEEEGFLTVYTRGGKGTCKGDSGGPLTYQQGQQHTIIGITSHGIPGNVFLCSGEKSYFTSVPDHIDWITSNVKDVFYSRQ